MNDNRPNVLMIMTDQHSKHALGCYGNDIVRTPNLDELASDGMVFHDAYCPSPLCVPSRMSFMTSRAPSRNRVWNNNHILSSGASTWAHAMTNAGYDTVLLGRMHFEGPDQRHGFQYRPVSEPNNGYPGVTPPGGPMWTKFPGSTSGQSRISVETAGRGHTHYQWVDEERTRAALRFLDERAERADDTPFAALLGYTLPHCPFVGLKELFDYYYDLVDLPRIEEEQPETVVRFRKLRGIYDPPLTSEQVRVARAAYFALCEHIDTLIGRVLSKLEECGLAENTLVVYCSDHGEMAGEHGCWWKSNYYEGSVGVPLIFRLPGLVAPSSVSRAVVNLIDIGPTVVELAGAAAMEHVDGRSLVPMLQTGADPDWSDETFSELIDHRGGRFPSRMIRSGKWKLWLYADDAGLPPTLFDLESDPDELQDLGRREEYREVVRELTTRLMADWRPQAALQESVEQWESFSVIHDWAVKTGQQQVDPMVLPPASYEDDVELL